VKTKLTTTSQYWKNKRKSLSLSPRRYTGAGDASSHRSFGAAGHGGGNGGVVVAGVTDASQEGAVGDKDVIGEQTVWYACAMSCE
jgi:hypothetical protein